MPRKAQSPACSSGRCQDVLDGRPGFRIAGEWGHVSVLEGGGHICELSSKAHQGINPLWRPQWKTIDPQKYEATKHSRSYGPLPDGRLLAGIAGHNLSFDYFGPPSKEEVAAGHSTHGEAPSLKWTVEAMTQAPVPTLQYGVTLPEAQIKFSRTISVDRLNPVVYCEEIATNLSSFDRPISWNEHVTYGPPFLECDTTLFDMPATSAKVCPPSYSSELLITPDCEFTWPMAPKEDGRHANLRTTPGVQFEHYTAQLLDPAREIAFTAACNPRLKLLVVYAFRRTDFPWVGNWEERFHQSHAPWNGRTFCRGIEFSTTPFAIPRRESVMQNRLFGEPTYRWLPARAKTRVRYVIMLLEVPTNFQGVDDVSFRGSRWQVRESGTHGRMLSLVTKAFL